MDENEVAQIMAYYSAGGEATRLQQRIGLLERARTRELLLRCLPPAPAVIYDVGGGTGVYAFWLAELGYEVHLFELSPENVRLAQTANAGATHPLVEIRVADARRLEAAAESADAVLLLGPLYHLPEQGERLLALREAGRALKSGGLLAAAAINRFASLLWTLSVFGPQEWLLREADIQKMVWRELEDGQHIRPESYPQLFTRAYFHLPSELRAEITGAGFGDTQVLPLEGPGWIVPELETVWAHPERWSVLMDAVRRVELAPEIIGMSPHLMGLGYKL